MNLFNIRLNLFLVGLLSLVSISAKDLSNDIMVRLKDKTYRIDTTPLGNQVNGYNGNTPLLVYIKNDQIIKIESLPNEETPAYYNRAIKRLFAQYIGMSVNKKDDNTQIDGVTGATYSSNAVKSNIEIAVKYYLSHK